MLKSVWFDQYKRQVANDSSAFEHTFVGEIRDGQVIGFHNWIQFFVEEKKGSADYRGYILPRRRNGAQKTPQAAHLMSFQFSWHGEVKPVSTFFIGTRCVRRLAQFWLLTERDLTLHLFAFCRPVPSLKSLFIRSSSWRAKKTMLYA